MGVYLENICIVYLYIWAILICKGNILDGVSLVGYYGKRIVKSDGIHSQQHDCILQPNWVLTTASKEVNNAVWSDWTPMRCGCFRLEWFKHIQATEIAWTGLNKIELLKTYGRSKKQRHLDQYDRLTTFTTFPLWRRPTGGWLVH